MFRLISLLCLLASGLQAQTDTEPNQIDTTAPIPFVAYWSRGDVYKFQVNKIDIRSKSGEEIKNDTTSYLGRFEVTDSTANSYTIKWSGNNYLGSNTGEQQDLVANVAASGTAFEHVIYTTDELGSFIRIENMEEILATLRMTFEAVLEGDNIKAMPDTAAAKIRSFMLGMVSPAFVRSKLLPELQLLHYPYGIEYLEFDTLTYDEELPNMFGGDNIRARNTLFIDSLDRQEEFIHLKQYTYIDKEEMKNVLLGVLNNLGNTTVEEEANSISFDVRNDNDFYFYYYPGIPIYIDYQRDALLEVGGETSYTTQRIEIEWVD